MNIGQKDKVNKYVNDELPKAKTRVKVNGEDMEDGDAVNAALSCMSAADCKEFMGKLEDAVDLMKLLALGNQYIPEDMATGTRALNINLGDNCEFISVGLTWDN